MRWRRTRRDRATVETEIATIRKPRWVADIITVTLTGDAPADLRLHWRTDCSGMNPWRPLNAMWPPPGPKPSRRPLRIGSMTCSHDR
jgi:hypothetical protein